MNSAYLHLLWKEYRAIRAFWLALVVLSLGLQLFVAAVFSDARMTVFNIALATPAFFAVGCIGTAFAIEKEDGSYDWLRASPATDLQVFAGKVGLCIVATLAMFAVLWPIALWNTGGQVPVPEVFHGVLALWLLAAVEAIAWGTLFSLRFERPLPAILLALVVTSTVIHLAAMPYATVTFNFDRFLSAVPFRLVVIALVLFYDVYLGLRWLQGEETRQQSTRNTSIAQIKGRTAAKVDSKIVLAAHRHTRDRGMLLSHLLWQHLRQSWRLMALLAGLQVAVTLLVQYSAMDNANLIAIVPLVGFAAIMGSSVFLPDQERRSYRFFTEHNVPARYVWLTRLAPWMFVAGAASLVTMRTWFGIGLLHQLIDVVVRMSQIHVMGGRYGRLGVDLDLEMPPALIGMAGAVLAFAAGQWFSMHVRSGLLAGFFSLLAAVVLTLWAWAVFAANLSWLGFIVPIVPVLLWATWFRAPDWTLENATWRARSKAALAVFAPTLALAIAAPFVRIAQYPPTKLSFSPAVFVSEITPEGLEVGQFYRRANELLVNRWSPTKEEIIDGQTVRSFMSRAEFLAANDDPLQLIFRATKREPSFLVNPQTLHHWPVVDDVSLMRLVTSGGRELESQGKLDEALDRYFATFAVQRQLTNHAPRMTDRSDERCKEALVALTGWGARSGQTDDRIRIAIERLKAIGDVINGADGMKSDYIVCRRFLELDQRVFSLFSRNLGGFLGSNVIRARLMPWERIHEQRMLDQMANHWLRTLATARSQMRVGESVWELADFYQGDLFKSPLGIASNFARWSNAAVCDTIAFEARNRATQIVLACQAYRLRHGQLPKTLADLAADPTANLSILAGVPLGGSLPLNQLPNDPYTGRPFVYFPHGIPKPPLPDSAEDFENRSDWRDNQMEFDMPCLWSPGPDVESHFRDAQGAAKTAATDVYYTHRENYFRYGESIQQPLPIYQAWARGQWFPIWLKVPTDDREP